jgi:TetR/AcrR family transcriptional repressor of nem operon
MGKKADSREKILDAAGHLFRSHGMAAVSIAEVMQASGMTHGGFYAHFKSKAELQAATMAHVATKQRQVWFSALDGMDAATILSSLTSRYLNPAHRDHPEDGCPYVALATDAARDDTAHDDAGLGPKFSQELEITIDRLITSGAVNDRDGALSYLSLCVGGLLLSRAVKGAKKQAGIGNLSDEFIRASRAASLRVLARPV